MEKQMKNPANNAVEINDADFEEVAGGLNLGAAPVSGDISPDKQLEKGIFNKDRLNNDKTTKIVAREIEKAEVAKTLKDVVSKDSHGM